MPINPKGYPVPDPIDPGELTCLTVYIPKSAPYIGAFFAAYESFGAWSIWARDPLHKGRSAARVWQRAIDLTRERWERLKGECQMAITAIRSNPLNKCEVQVQLDGGPTWEHAFNISDCASVGAVNSGALRYNGSSIQQYDPCTGAWSDLGPATNPAYTGTEPGQWPGEECGHGLAAANLARVLEDSKNKMCEAVGALANFATVVLQILETVAAFIGLGDSIVVTGWLTAAWAYLEVHYTDVAAFDLYEALSPVLPEYFNTDGSIDATGFQGMLDRITMLMNAEANPSPGRTAYGYALSWVTAAGPVGVVRANKAGNVTTVDCSAIEWRQVWDTTQTPGPFVVDTSLPGLRGRWTPGVGWVANYSQPGPTFDVRIVEIGVHIAATNITYAGMTFDNFGGVFTVLALQEAGIQINSGAPLTIAGENHNLQIAQTAPTSATFIGFFVRAGYTDDSRGVDPGGTGVIRRIEIRGTGRNPFTG